MGPARYYSKGMQASADLKRVAHTVRTSHPQLFKTVEDKRSAMDGDGKVTVVVSKYSRANPLKPAVRHAICTKDS